MESFNNERKRPLYDRIMTQLFIGGIYTLSIVMAILITGMYLLVTLGYPFYLLQIVADLGLPHWAVIAIVTAIAVGAGLILYRIRSDARFLYGTVELSFAVTALILTVEKQVGQWTTAHTLNTDNWVALVAGIYLIVRGSDNLVEGYKKMGEESDREHQEAWRKWNEEQERREASEGGPKYYP